MLEEGRAMGIAEMLPSISRDPDCRMSGVRHLAAPAGCRASPVQAPSPLSLRPPIFLMERP